MMVRTLGESPDSGFLGSFSVMPNPNINQPKMPQPLSSVLFESVPIIMCNAGDRPLRHNPMLGLLAMEAIISWSNFELFMLNAYLELMGGKKELAAIGYLAIEIQSAKIAMTRAIAKERLNDKYYDLLDVILSLAKSSQKSRDKLAHWLWGYTPRLKDAFLLADPKDMATMDLFHLDTEKIYVFNEKDFNDIIKLNDRLCGFGANFRYILMGHSANEGDALYHKLCGEPEIQERRAARQASQTQSPQ